MADLPVGVQVWHRTVASGPISHWSYRPRLGSVNIGAECFYTSILLPVTVLLPELRNKFSGKMRAIQSV